MLPRGVDGSPWNETCPLTEPVGSTAFAPTLTAPDWLEA